MKRCLWLAGLLLALISASLVPARVVVAEAPPAKTLQAFSSEEELADFFAKELLPRWQAHAKKAEERQQKAFGLEMPAPASSPAKLESAAQDSAATESVTNVQHAGVDEGGIVKLHGNHLVVLRRGRLFTVDIGGATASPSGEKGLLRPVSAIEAYGQDMDPAGTWYDEMLISGDTIFVIGYSYARGGTEIGLFSIDDAGALTYKSTYHLRSADYYSARNFASRLVQGKLVFYSPLPFSWRNVRDGNVAQAFPALRKWHAGAKEEDFHLIAPSRNTYKPLSILDLDDPLTLHSVTTCEPKQNELVCESSVVIGPWGRVFYVSPKAVYVWTTHFRRTSPDPIPGEIASDIAALYRLPLDGSAPSALQVEGSPVDQFSFLESADGFLNVLVGGTGGGDNMWRANESRGPLRLLRIPLDDFADGSTVASYDSFRRLSGPREGALLNRFIGDFLLYGSAEESKLYAVRWAKGQQMDPLLLGQRIERIEPMGNNALVAGNRGSNLQLTSVRLSDPPSAVDRYVRKNAVQGEERSHGFFYKPLGADTGLLGLPVVGTKQGRSSLRRESASVLFLRNASLKLAGLGELAARADAGDDGCKASCVDWYGNSRPLFVRGRVFALLGYELVEGKLTQQGGIEEVQRVNFAPKAARR